MGIFTQNENSDLNIMLLLIRSLEDYIVKSKPDPRPVGLPMELDLPVKA